MEVYARVVGRGTFQNSQVLRRYALDMIERGCERMVVDLGQCQGMDSTFLGVLAGIGLRLQQNGHKGWIDIINAGPHCLQLLQTLGLDRLFKVGAPVPSAAADDELSKLPDSDVTVTGKRLDKADTARLMLECHENLIRADKRNAPKFEGVTRMLREDIAQHEKKEPSKPS